MIMSTVKQHIIIAKDNSKLSNQTAWVELHKMYSKKEIQENGYYLGNRFQFGPFRANTGKIKTTIHFENRDTLQQTRKIIFYTLCQPMTTLRFSNISYNFTFREQNEQSAAYNRSKRYEQVAFRMPKKTVTKESLS